MNKRTLLVQLLIAVFLFTSLMPAPKAEASFVKNKVISDNVLDNKDTMGAGKIDNFLNKFSNSCISPNSGFAAIKPTGYNPTDGFLYGSYATAGNVIYAAAQAYNINPQVLLATLQKEQSLVTGGGANGCGALAISASMGYSCPDGGTSHDYSGLSLYRRNGTVVSSVNNTCVNSAAAAGFSQQTIRAAWQLKFNQQRSKGNYNWAVIKGSWDNSDDPGLGYSGPMTKGRLKRCAGCATISYDGYWTIDGESVFMTYGGTASFYSYTPHFSGNRLFVNTFENWFGPAVVVKCTSSDTAGSKVYRLFSTKYGRHFYTAMECEAYYMDATTSYRIEGIPFYQAPADGDDRTPVYRLKKRDSSLRYWTSSARERDNLVNHGYVLEGTAFIEYKKTSTSVKSPVYRLYNSKTGGHLWTTSANERDNVNSQPSWKYEGVAFYVHKP